MTYSPSSRLLGKASPRFNPSISAPLVTALLVALTLSGCTGSIGAGRTSSKHVNPAPSITTQPTSQTIVVGQTEKFSVADAGTAPLSYQWQKNGASIAGASSSSYTTPVTTTGDSGATFAVVAANMAGTVTST